MMEKAIKIMDEADKKFEQIITEWLSTPPERETKKHDDLPILLEYLNVIKSYGVISQARLGQEVGNVGRDDRFQRYIRRLKEFGCVKRIDCEEAKSFARRQGNEWMESMNINPSFRRPPVIYFFVKDFSMKTKEEIEQETNKC
jgi:hypothetical protein